MARPSLTIATPSWAFEGTLVWPPYLQWKKTGRNTTPQLGGDEHHGTGGLLYVHPCKPSTFMSKKCLIAKAEGRRLPPKSIVRHACVHQLTWASQEKTFTTQVDVSQAAAVTVTVSAKVRTESSDGCAARRLAQQIIAFLALLARGGSVELFSRSTTSRQKKCDKQINAAVRTGLSGRYEAAVSTKKTNAQFGTVSHSVPNTSWQHKTKRGSDGTSADRSPHFR